MFGMTKDGVRTLPLSPERVAHKAIFSLFFRINVNFSLQWNPLLELQYKKQHTTRKAASLQAATSKLQQNISQLPEMRQRGRNWVLSPICQSNRCKHTGIFTLPTLFFADVNDVFHLHYNAFYNCNIPERDATYHLICLLIYH